MSHEACDLVCMPAGHYRICEVCNDDVRMVTTNVQARRFAGGGGASHVFPCPCCGQFYSDADGKMYGTAGLRYGNPTIRDAADYAAWRGRNAPKLSGWTTYQLYPSEEGKARRLRETFPRAPEVFIRYWVLGQREVYREQQETK